MIARHRLTATCFVVALALTASLALAGTAMASFHLVKISEVHVDGDAGGPDHDYVELRMFASGQNSVQGHYIRTYDNGGNELDTFTFPNSVQSGQSQRTILVANGPTVLGGLIPDFDATLSGGLNVAEGMGGGYVCYINTLGVANGVDCVSYGMHGSATMLPTGLEPIPSPFGDPAVFSTGLVAATGKSLQRTITRRCNTLLEAADDTNNSAADFILGDPSPRKNSSKPTERSCVPCGGKRSTITGTGKSETLRGTSGRDVIAGKGGNDRLRGLAGNDIICGGKGNDRLIGGKGKDRLFGQAGTDVLRGGAGKDVQVQ